MGVKRVAGNTDGDFSKIVSRRLTSMASAFHESTPPGAGLKTTAIRDLHLTIEGTALEPVITEFLAELDQVGIRRVRPRFYLSTEWGVPYDTIAIAIPFYLARPDLTELHAERTGFVEGFSRWDILRYLRHEMGHVVNYAYRLYDREEWIKLFGAITQPYLDAYRPQPFSQRYVRHLPGWYAQKHPDEDWAETFAVWMTPGSRWRVEYADASQPLAKLNYCDTLMRELAELEPLVTAADPDEDVGEISASLEQYYQASEVKPEAFPPGLDGSLQAIFEDEGHPESDSRISRAPAVDLLRRLRPELMVQIFRWTGHFPEHTNSLMHHLIDRAAALNQVYRVDRETQMAIAITTLVTALAMNYIHTGAYLS